GEDGNDTLFGDAGDDSINGGDGDDFIFETIGNDPLRLAVVGRPNVGKSTLINRLVGEDRLLAFDQPGTTRDSIAVPFERDGQAYILVDTAGVRRRSRVDDRIEKFSIIKTLQAIEGAHGAVVMLDGRSGVVDQDLHLLGLVVDAGRGLVVAVNKWDHLPVEQKSQVRRELERRLGFLTFADVHFISALHGTGVVDVLASLRVACESARRKFSTPELTRLLETVVAQHPPPAVGRGQRIKLRYAHQGGQNPPVIVIHGGRTDQVPISYRRYLTNAFRDALGLKGTPLVVELRSGENPYRPGERRPPKSR
ncbi:MAG: ribosome biogenesis GTPase Der, partial [Candidatus Competibacterales bacterium]